MPDRVEPLVLRQVRRQVALWSRSAYDNASHLHQFEQFCDWRRFALLPQNGRDHVTLTKRALSRIGKWGSLRRLADTPWLPPRVSRSSMSNAESVRC